MHKQNPIYRLCTSIIIFIMKKYLHQPYTESSKEKKTYITQSTYQWYPVYANIMSFMYENLTTKQNHIPGKACAIATFDSSSLLLHRNPNTVWDIMDSLWRNGSGPEDAHRRCIAHWMVQHLVQPLAVKVGVGLPFFVVTEQALGEWCCLEIAE